MRRRKNRYQVILGVLLSGVLALGSVVATENARADEIDDQKAAAEQEFAAKAAERAELEKSLEGTNEKLRMAVLALHDVEAKIPATKAELAKASAASETAAREVADLAQKLADAEAELAAVEQLREENETLVTEAHKQMAALARQAARGDQLTIVGMITGAQSADEFVAHTTTTAAVARSQARTVASVQDADAVARNTAARIAAITEQINNLKAQAEIAYTERQAAEQAAIAKQNEIASLYAKQVQLTDEIEDQRDEELQEIEDNKADQEAIAKTIQELSAQQAERDRIIAEKRRQEELAAQQRALEEQQRLQAEQLQKDTKYQEAKQAYEQCLTDAKAANDALVAAAASPTPAAPPPAPAPAPESGEGSETGTDESTDTEATVPAPAPAPTPEPVVTTDPATTCAAMAPQQPPPPPAPVVPPAPSFSGFLSWPTDNHTVTSSYGWRYHPTLHINRLHAGTDLRAQCGVPIYAAQSGIVVKREWYGTGGNMVLIDHGKDDNGSNIMTRYLHLSAYNVALNQWVTRGQVIGYSGMTGGVSTGCHLHFEVYVNGSHVDPLSRLP